MSDNSGCKDETVSADRCGKPTQSSGLCSREPGWGTDKDSGPCKFHLDERNNDLKNKFLQILEEEVISIQNAARRIDRNPSTVRKWRYKDEDFDQKVEQAKQRQEELRGEKLKDSVFKRAINGEATGAEVIFALKNTTDWGDEPDTEINNVQQQMQNQKQEQKNAFNIELDVVDNTGDYRKEFQD